MATKEQKSHGEEQSLVHPGSFLSSLSSNPFSIMRRLSEDMERVFDGFGPWESRWPRLWRGLETAGAWSPNVNLYERKGQLVVRTDLPGLTKDDVKVEVADGRLVIEGERKMEQEEKNERHYRTECSYGAFRRVIALPEGCKPDEAKATFKNGVLEVTVPAPARPEKQGRQLKIEAK